LAICRRCIRPCPPSEGIFGPPNMQRAAHRRCIVDGDGIDRHNSSLLASDPLYGRTRRSQTTHYDSTMAERNQPDGAMSGVLRARSLPCPSSVSYSRQTVPFPVVTLFLLVAVIAAARRHVLVDTWGPHAPSRAARCRSRRGALAALVLTMSRFSIRQASRL
jgi:hypothetical protein